MLGTSRELFIRETARRVLRELWRERGLFWMHEVDPLTFVHEAPRLIIEKVLQIRLEEPQEVALEDILKTGPAPGYKVAGFLNREECRIVVVRDCKEEWRRFTLGHELGHWLLHPALCLHRDRPVSGAEGKSSGRPVQEVEADVFSAELHMPQKLLRKVFFSNFGGVIDGRDLARASTYTFALPLGHSFCPKQFSTKGKEFRAFIAATAIGSILGPFVPLNRAFKVSPTAMAIQLLDHALVL